MLDEAQRYLDGIIPDAFDLRGLLWEVLGDALDSVRLAELTQEQPGGPPPGGIHNILADYLGDNYGDE